MHSCECGAHSRITNRTRDTERRPSFTLCRSPHNRHPSMKTVTTGHRIFRLPACFLRCYVTKSLVEICACVDHLRTSFRACALNTYPTLGGAPFFVFITSGRSVSFRKAKVEVGSKHPCNVRFVEGAQKHSLSARKCRTELP